MLRIFKRDSTARGGGGEDQLAAADPPHGVLGPIEARLETCVVAAFGYDKSNPLSKRRGVHCMTMANSCRKAKNLVKRLKSQCI